MKVDSLINSADEMVLLNERQAQKIKFLEAEKQRNQNYIKDIKESLDLNKKSLTLITSKSSNSAIKTLNEQNSKLHSIINRYYQQSMTYEAKLLIEEQLRNEEKKYFNERLLEFETTMSELRKFLQDKEDSFSAIVMRLKKYQDLCELTLSTKIEKFKREVREGCLQDFIRELTEQRDQYKQMFEKVNVDMNDLIFLKECLTNKKSYESLRESYRKHQLTNSMSLISDNGKISSQKSKSTVASSFQISPQTKINPNRELIRLLKKQKLNNEILQQALNDAIQKNTELVQEINQIYAANNDLEGTVQKLESQIILLENQLSNYEFALKPKKYWKSKCDLDRPSREANKFKAEGDQPQIHLSTLKQDMNKMAKFIMTCIPTKKLAKSLSSYDLCRKNTKEREIIDDEIEIEEVY